MPSKMSGAADPWRSFPTNDFNSGEKKGDVWMHRVNLVSFSFMMACSMSPWVVHSCLTGVDEGLAGVGVCQILITFPDEDFFVTLEMRRHDWRLFSS